MRVHVSTWFVLARTHFFLLMTSLSSEYLALVSSEKLHSNVTQLSALYGDVASPTFRTCVHCACNGPDKTANVCFSIVPSSRGEQNETLGELLLKLPLTRYSRRVIPQHYHVRTLE